MTASPSAQSPRVAVLIDCDNVSWQRGPAIIAEAATHGVLGVKRGYGDWGSNLLSGWRKHLTALAIQPIQQIAYVKGKGATDTALIIDAMDLLYSGQVDTFCLVASDSDYTRLAIRLREAGKRVVGIGQKKTPSAFSNACDRFTFLELLPVADESEEPDPTSVHGTEGEESVEANAADQEAPTAADELPSLREVLRSAVSSRSEDDGWALLSNVGWHLVANHPTFDARNYGYARLGQLVRDQDYLEIREAPGGDNRGLQVRLRDDAAA